MFVYMIKYCIVMTQPFIYSLFSRQIYFSQTQYKISSTRLPKYCKRYNKFVLLPVTQTSTLHYSEIDYNRHSSIFLQQLKSFLKKL